MQFNMSIRSDQFFDFETEQYSGGRQMGMGSTMSMTSTDYDVDSIATQFGSMSFDQMSTQSYGEVVCVSLPMSLSSTCACTCSRPQPHGQRR